MADQPPSRKRAPAVWITALVVTVGIGAVLFRPDRDVTAATPAPSTASTPSQEEAPPAERVRLILKSQAAALLAGDEKAWLAPVGKKLQPRHRAIFQNLRALDVTAALMEIDDSPDMTGTTMKVRVKLSYCFSGAECLLTQTADHRSPPKLVHRLTWTAGAGSYTITGMAPSGITNGLEPAPWEDDLRIVRGARVTLAASASQTEHLERILPLAEKAAVAADLYATGHFAVGCLVAKYGEAKMLDFVTRVLRKGEQIDPASRAAFGKPFKTVDRTCVTWINQRS